MHRRRRIKEGTIEYACTEITILVIPLSKLYITCGASFPT